MLKWSLGLGLACIVAFGSSARAENYVVQIVDNAFRPSSLYITEGDTVTWAQQATLFNHTTTSDDGLWNSGAMGAFETFDWTFNSPGEFPYHCQFHATDLGDEWFGMTGTIVVDANQAPEPGSLLLLVGLAGMGLLRRRA